MLKDCRLYAPDSQIWPEYKLETASCYMKIMLPYFNLFPHIHEKHSEVCIETKSTAHFYSKIRVLRTQL